jgi:dihydropteroate synthase
MGILNVTPDSFSDGGKFNTVETAIKKGISLIEDGADILDIGGESTRPGADLVSENEELKRIIPVIKELRSRYKTPISVDTNKSEVARIAIDNGATFVNDVSGLTMDEKMVELVANKNVPIVIMHMKGTPKTMQKKPQYTNVVQEIFHFLENQTNFALKNGVKPKNIIIDPGFGFGKTVNDNFELLAKLNIFTKLKYPILVGTSRKSFIGKILKDSVDKRIEGTSASVAISILNGAKIVRVHDVLEMKKVCKIVDKTMEMC